MFNPSRVLRNQCKLLVNLAPRVRGLSFRKSPTFQTHVRGLPRGNTLTLQERERSHYLIECNGTVRPQKWPLHHHYICWAVFIRAPLPMLFLPHMDARRLQLILTSPLPARHSSMDILSVLMMSEWTPQNLNMACVVRVSMVVDEVSFSLTV